MKEGMRTSVEAILLVCISFICTMIRLLFVLECQIVGKLLVTFDNLNLTMTFVA